MSEENLMLSVERVSMEIHQVSLEVESVENDVRVMQQVADDLEQIGLAASASTLEEGDVSVAQEVIDVSVSVLGIEPGVITLESISSRLKDLWKAIEAGIRKSMQTISTWYSKISEGIDVFLAKVRELKQRVEGSSIANAPSEIRLTGEQTNLFLKSSETHPGVVAALKSLTPAIGTILDDEYKHTYNSARDALKRLEIPKVENNRVTGAPERKVMINTVKEDLEVSGILTNMADPKFKTKVWTVLDKNGTKIAKTRYLFDNEPIAGGKTLAIEGPAYGGFNQDGMKLVNDGSLNNYNKIMAAAKERAGIRSKMIRLKETIPTPKQYLIDVRMKPMSADQIVRACDVITEVLEALSNYRKTTASTVKLKEDLLKKGEGLVDALGDNPSKEWTSFASFKQSLLNYHVARLDTVQNHYLKHAMQVMHSAIKVCEKSLTSDTTTVQ
jgi:archaellum component FlaC